MIKRITKGKLLWMRAAISNLFSQMLDSFVVSYIAFSLGKTLTGQTAATMKEVMNIALTGYGLKFAIAVVMMPLLYVLRHFMKENFGLVPLPAELATS